MTTTHDKTPQEDDRMTPEQLAEKEERMDREDEFRDELHEEKVDRAEANSMAW